MKYSSRVLPGTSAGDEISQVRGGERERVSSSGRCALLRFWCQEAPYVFRFLKETWFREFRQRSTDRYRDSK